MSTRTRGDRRTLRRNPTHERRRTASGIAGSTALVLLLAGCSEQSGSAASGEAG